MGGEGGGRKPLRDASAFSRSGAEQTVLDNKHTNDSYSLLLVVKQRCFYALCSSSGRRRFFPS